MVLDLKMGDFTLWKWAIWLLHWYYYICEFCVKEDSRIVFMIAALSYDVDWGKKSTAILNAYRYRHHSDIRKGITILMCLMWHLCQWDCSDSSILKSHCQIYMEVHCSWVCKADQDLWQKPEPSPDDWCNLFLSYCVLWMEILCFLRLLLNCFTGGPKKSFLWPSRHKTSLHNGDLAWVMSLKIWCPCNKNYNFHLAAHYSRFRLPKIAEIVLRWVMYVSLIECKSNHTAPPLLVFSDEDDRGWKAWHVRSTIVIFGYQRGVLGGSKGCYSRLVYDVKEGAPVQGKSWHLHVCGLVIRLLIKGILQIKKLLLDNVAIVQWLSKKQFLRHEYLSLCLLPWNRGINCWGIAWDYKL